MNLPPLPSEGESRRIQCRQITCPPVCPLALYVTLELVDAEDLPAAGTSWPRPTYSRSDAEVVAKALAAYRDPRTHRVD